MTTMDRINAPESDFDLLVVGVAPAIADSFLPRLQGIEVKWLSEAAEVEALLEAYRLKPGTPLLCGSHLRGMGHSEVGQAFSSYFKGLNIIFLTNERAEFDLPGL